MTNKIKKIKTYNLISLTPRFADYLTDDLNLLICEVNHYEGVYMLDLMPGKAHTIKGYYHSDPMNCYRVRLEEGRYSAKKIETLAHEFLTFEKVQEIAQASPLKFHILQGGTD